MNKYEIQYELDANEEECCTQIEGDSKVAAINTLLLHYRDTTYKVTQIYSIVKYKLYKPI